MLPLALVRTVEGGGLSRNHLVAGHGMNARKTDGVLSAAAPSAASLFLLGPLFSTIAVGAIMAAVVTTVVVVTGS